MKKLAVALTAVIALFGFGALAHAQYTPSVSAPGTVNPGQAFNATVSGCQGNSAYTWSFDGQAGGGTTDASGGATIALTAPTAPGDYPVVVNCSGSTASTNVGVVDPSAAPTNGGNGGNGGGSAAAPTAGGTGGGTVAGTIPATGSDSIQTGLLIGAGAVIVGLGLLGTAHIRRRQTASA